MQLDEATLKFNQIFAPDILERALEVYNRNSRFAYYTDASTAKKIIQNGELWLRNATVMNDFSEISYGLDLISEALRGPLKERFEEAVDSIHAGTFNSVDELISGWENDWRYETYIACVSLHEASEDQNGRLSMWRAYGNTALVINNTPMMAVTDLLAVYSLPVLYLSPQQYKKRLEAIIDRMLKNKSYLQSLSQETLVSYLHNMFFQTAICTKHPGFSEEKEWRIFYRPNQRSSATMVPKVEVIGGTPQTVYTLPLLDDPTKGLHGADIPNLINRLIIGPTEFPYVSFKAFVTLLSEANVADPEQKVFSSKIPLRT